nr:outer membrane beta-barrel protein [Bradyrhizobium sp. Oc8]
MSSRAATAVRARRSIKGRALRPCPRRHRHDGFTVAVLRNRRSCHRRIEGRPDQQDEDGWTAGGGVEWAFLPKWSAKAEYPHTEFKHDDLPDWTAAKFHSFRVGVNCHFDLFR